MKKMLFSLIVLFTTTTSFSQKVYDLVIVGGTPGGIMTAIAAAREGKTSVILERTEHVGGLPVNGLGATDIATRGATTGLFKEFIDRIYNYYITQYGKDSKQVKDCSNGYHFEPHVAEKIFNQMLGEHEDKIAVIVMGQFDSEPDNVELNGNNIVSIKILNRLTNTFETYSGKIFIDATYEGDLAAAAKVPFVIGREGKDKYNERGAGRVYKYWKGPEGGGSTFLADNSVQAYNYRLCLTNDVNNRVLPQKPENYVRNEYFSLVDDVLSGRHTGAEMLKVTQVMMDENRMLVLKGNRTKIPGDVWGMAKLSSMTTLPNSKTDANNQHLAFISTDLPEENWPWPTSGWEWRNQFAKRLKEYTLGLIYFAQNDTALPANFRNACREWGLAKDEYIDNDNFPRQVYVREGRRFKGEYFFKAQDAMPIAEGKRPPLHFSSITASHYAHDSHAVRKREKGKTGLDGFLSYPTSVYTVPYGVIIPKCIDNLLIPVPVSGSHIGFSTLRMEPCWMALGQAAGIAASMAIDFKVSNKKVRIDELQQKLVQQKATLVYYEDVSVNSHDFEMVQYMGLRGYLPGWNADLDAIVDAEIIKPWSSLAKRKIQGLGKKKRDVLYDLYLKFIK